MRVVPHTQFQKPEAKKRNIAPRLFVGLVAFVMITSGIVFWQLQRSTVSAQAIPTFQTGMASPMTPLAWPTFGQAAVGEVSQGLLESHGTQTPVATASTAKLITALAVLKAKPLSLNQPGPNITISQSDIDLYNSYIAQDGSVVPVILGEQISQYQMLEGLLLPSANNFADGLANWAFGSVSQYAAYANTLLQSWGLKNTVVGSDASGLSASTKSTANDLLVITQKAMQHPVIAQIVAKKQSTIPMAGTIYNTNGLLGFRGIVGVKTGNTNEAGGVFTIAAEHTVGGTKLTLIASVMGGPTLGDSMRAASALIESAKQNFEVVRLAQAGQKAGSYSLPWGGTVTASVAKNLETVSWKKHVLEPTVTLKPLRSATKQGTKIGTLSYKTLQGTNIQADIVLDQPANAPSIQWRLLHS